MAASPGLKIYSPDGEYVASCKYSVDAAVLVASYGNGATIRNGHNRRSIVWEEGAETQSASDSYDFVSETITRRVHDSYPAQEE